MANLSTSIVAIAAAWNEGCTSSWNGILYIGGSGWRGGENEDAIWCAGRYFAMGLAQLSA